MKPGREILLRRSDVVACEDDEIEDVDGVDGRGMPWDSEGWEVR